MLSSSKLHTSGIVITKSKSFINILKSKGSKIEPWGTPLYHIKSYMKSIFSFFAYGEKSNQESMTTLSYQFHNIPIWLLEDRVLYNHILLITNALHKRCLRLFHGFIWFVLQDVNIAWETLTVWYSWNTMCKDDDRVTSDQRKLQPEFDVSITLISDWWYLKAICFCRGK